MFTGIAEEKIMEYLFNRCVDEQNELYHYTNFILLPLSMQFGVIQDFSESLGFEVKVGYDYHTSDDIHYDVTINNSKHECCYYEASVVNRNKARTIAKRELNRIINLKEK